MSDTQIIVELVKGLFDNKEKYQLNMFWANRSTSVADPGRPSVANTFGTILLNLAANGTYSSRKAFSAAIVETGDRTLIQNRKKVLRRLLNSGQFIERRVKGSGSTQVLFPSEELLQCMYANMELRREREESWSNTRCQQQETRQKRSQFKCWQLDAQQKQLRAIAEDLGYNLC